MMVRHKLVKWFIALAMILQFGCMRIPLSKEYIGLNPYTKNDVLVFQSNKTGKTDTLYVYDIWMPYQGGGSPKFVNYQGMTIYAFYPHYYGRNEPLRSSNLFYFNPQTNISFNVVLNKEVRFLAKMKTLDYLNIEQFQTIEVGGKVYSDVIELEDRFFMENRPDIAPRAYWSKSQGFIRIEKFMGEQFDLISKYQDTATCEAIRLKEKEPIGDKR